MHLMEKLFKGMQGIAFGLIEGIIFILGLSLGISALQTNPLIVFVIGLTGGIADAFANATGFLVSEEVESEQKIANHTKKEVFFAAAFVFLFTIIAVVLTLVPYLFFGINEAMTASMIIGLGLLFIFGAFHATQSKENMFIEGIKFAFYGFIASIICFAIGSMLPGLILK